VTGRGWKTRRGDLALLEKNVRVDGDLEVKGGLGAVAMAEGTNTRRLQDLCRRLQKRKMASMCRSIGADDFDLMLLSPNHIASVPEGAKETVPLSLLSLFLSRLLLSSAYRMLTFFGTSPYSLHFFTLSLNYSKRTTIIFDSEFAADDLQFSHY